MNFIAAQGTQAQFDAVTAKDINTVYYIDNKKIYKGENLLYAGTFTDAVILPSGKLQFTATDGTVKAIDLFTVTDTGTIDMTYVNGSLKGDVKVSATAGNSIAKNGDGLFVPAVVAPFITNIEDTNSINLDVTPTTNGTLKGDLKLDASTKNILKITAAGVNATVSLDYNGATGMLSVKDTAGAVLNSVNLPLEQNLDAAKWFLNQASFDADTTFKAGIISTVIPAGGAIVMKMIINGTTPTYSAIVVPTLQLIPANIITESEIGNGLQVATGAVSVKIDVTSTAGVLSVGAGGIKVDTSSYLKSTTAATTYYTQADATVLKGSKVDKTTTINNKSLSANVILAGSDILVTGYVKATAATAIVVTDTVNVALGKLEKSIESATTGVVKSVIEGNGVTVKNVAGNVTVSVKAAPTQENVVITANANGVAASFQWVDL